MTVLSRLQRQCLLTGFRSRGYITVVVTLEGDVSVRAGGKRVRSSADPLDGLVAARLLRLIGEFEDRNAMCARDGIRGVRLYELTSEGCAAALEVEVGAPAADRGQLPDRSRPAESGD